MDSGLFFRLHDGLPRQAPGSDAATQDAVRRLKPHGLPDDPRVLDIGCGPGRSLMVLGRVTGGRVIGIDLHEPFLAEAQARIDAAGLGRRLSVHKRSMLDLPAAGDGLFEPGSFDLLWAEGSICLAGFDEGLRRWRPLLRPGGLFGLTELTWLTADPPAEAVAFWRNDYPALRDEAANRAAAVAAGYRVLDSFALPPEAWWDEYYGPLGERIAAHRTAGTDHPAWAAVLDAAEAEITLYRRAGHSYGYVFYLLKRDG